MTGSGFQKGLTVTLVTPDGAKNALTGTDIVLAGDKEIQINPTLSETGIWKISVANPDKTNSDDFQFQVIDVNSPSVQAYKSVFWVITIVLGVSGLALLIGLLRASAKGTWSLGTALSEEASYQPQQIKSPADILLVGSTSRLIALVGLLGILAIVLGIGYSIIWNLFVSGKVPDLGTVKSFLFGAAALFAPYLANQIRAAFDQPAAPASENSSNALAITGVIPGSPRSGAGQQPLTLTGKGFDSGVAVTLIDPAGTEALVPSTQITSINPTQLALNVTLDAPGTWKVRVTSAGGSPSAMADVAVYGAPMISTITVGAAAPPATTRNITLTGKGFLKGLTASLANPTGATVTVTIKSVNYTQLVLSAELTTGNNWRVAVRNPGGFETPQQFNVT